MRLAGSPVQIFRARSLGVGRGAGRNFSLSRFLQRQIASKTRCKKLPFPNVEDSGNASKTAVCYAPPQRWDLDDDLPWSNRQGSSKSPKPLGSSQNRRTPGVSCIRWRLQQPASVEKRVEEGQPVVHFSTAGWTRRVLPCDRRRAHGGFRVCARALEAIPVEECVEDSARRR